MSPNNSTFERRTVLKRAGSVLAGAAVVGSTASTATASEQTTISVSSPGNSSEYAEYGINTTEQNVTGSVAGGTNTHEVGVDARIKLVLVEGGPINIGLIDPTPGADVHLARIRVFEETDTGGMGYSFSLTDDGDEPNECTVCVGWDDTALLEDDDYILGQDVIGNLEHPDADKDVDIYGTSGQAFESLSLDPNGGTMKVYRY